MLHAAAKTRMRFPYAGVAGNIFTYKDKGLDVEPTRPPNLFKHMVGRSGEA